ncbi:cytochrome b5-like [Athalia rosae]|uniref:cytochrome b5-like n=1 Tax=Athalia rosae TaxID=37344 RepID=UPI000625967B|nr:cytochrome b5-like [Athalia rosae]XP_012258741.1 cytochrome b5-like [Athalia rosae]
MATGKRLFTRAEVKNNADPKSVWFIVHNKVYDVTEFLNEHPGGEEILAQQRGTDASEFYDDVGHSDEAIELKEKYLIGEIVESERSKTQPKKFEWSAPQDKKSQETNSNGLSYGLIAAALIIVLLAYNFGLIL